MDGDELNLVLHRRLLANAEAEVVRLRERLDRATGRGLPPEGTPLSEALWDEADTLAVALSRVPSWLAAGHAAGWRAFVDGLYGRAEQLHGTAEDLRRPEPATGTPVRAAEPAAPGPRELADVLRERDALERRLAEWGAGTAAADRRWRNALAAELRHAADRVAASGSADPFVCGYDMASVELARLARFRADEIAVAENLWLSW